MDDVCLWCQEKILPTDRISGTIYVDANGQPTKRKMHFECSIRSIVGGFAHLHKTCHCCGGNDPPDPPHLSLREAAKLAAYTWQRGHTEERARRYL